jgi:hypothetical protein
MIGVSEAIELAGRAASEVLTARALSEQSTGLKGEVDNFLSSVRAA